MNKKANVYGYMARFIVVYVPIYIVVALLFLAIQEVLPDGNKVALEFFRPYRYPTSAIVVAQVMVGGIMALALYPFYGRIIGDKRGWLILFGALWGLAYLGGLEPIPGSIEGLIYTETTLLEHIMVMVAGGTQLLVFSWIFLAWENRVYASGKMTNAGGALYG